LVDVVNYLQVATDTKLTKVQILNDMPMVVLKEMHDLISQIDVSLSPCCNTGHHILLCLHGTLDEQY
jgi:hypothetical protein